MKKHAIEYYTFGVALLFTCSDIVKYYHYIDLYNHYTGLIIKPCHVLRTSKLVIHLSDVRDINYVFIKLIKLVAHFHS